MSEKNDLPDPLLRLKEKIMKSSNLKGEIESIFDEYKSSFLNKQKKEEQTRLKIKKAIDHIIASKVPDSEIRNTLEQLSEKLEDELLGDWIDLFSGIKL